MGASFLSSGAMILSKPRPKVEQILTALRDRFACRSRFVPFDGVERLVTTTGHIRSRSRSGRSTSGRAGGDRCGMSVARATSTRSLTGSGPPRSVGARVVVGFQCFTAHWASASSSCLPNRSGYAIPAMAAPMSGAIQTRGRSCVTASRAILRACQPTRSYDCKTVVDDAQGFAAGPADHDAWGTPVLQRDGDRRAER